ncbi:unnamed protein product [Adineta steineri]|uniref:Uncharacterized protein n=2 Tax=Adineta steineri TaxID=433720 RepID=A0A814CBE8_9BILA|nr:unnamed protein product [Adineta steineri]
MGNRCSKKRVLPFSLSYGHNQSQDNNLGVDFYWACRNGNLQTVIDIYPKLAYKQLNEIQPNGSTALHDACARNHPHIVKFLLDNGCCRTTLNSQHQTAYELASEEIKRLFDRPWSQRFVQERGADLFCDRPSGDSQDQLIERPDDWVTGRTNIYSTYEAQFMLALGQSSSMFKNIVKKRLERNHNEELLNLLNKSITSTNPEHREAKDLIDKFLNKLGVHHLITLYTLETDFYRNLRQEADALTAILYLNLKELQNRAFKGRAYRGAGMTESDLDAYRWALQKKETWHDNLLETRILQSLSIKKSVALEFAKNSSDANLFSVLIEFEFSEYCPTAISLFKISNQLPGLSNYEKEAEVLLLPFTLFKLQDIKADLEQREYRIFLKHQQTPKESLRQAAGEVSYFSQ